MFEYEEEEEANDFKYRFDQPLKAKARELFKIVQAITADLPESEELDQLAGFMFQDVGVINAKIAGASVDTLYSIKMQNAALIRKSAMDLYVWKHSFAEEGYTNMQYFDLLRSTLDEFRELFIDWVDSFDPWNYVKDEWGLFNPPGVHARDKDPDDDIPFINPLNPDGDEE
jgi:hypothetical protein